MGNWKCFSFEHNSIIPSTLLLPPDSFSLVWLEQARLIGSLLYGARAKLVYYHFAGFCNQTCTAQHQSGRSDLPRDYLALQ